MTASDYLTMILTFVGGIGMFLFGMHTMATGLQKTSGTKMKKLLGALTTNKFMGVIVGALVTGIIQSSAATTVMVVGFVNAGIMNLSQTVGIIMGANIGTTVTAWLVSSAEWMEYFSLEQIAPVAVLIGAACLLFTKKQKFNQIGEIVVGFGILFIGITTMSEGVHVLRDLTIFKDAFMSFGSIPVLGILIGAVVTVLLQSSSASVAILQTLAVASIVPWNAAVYIIMGQNIGTCVTAMLSSIGTSKNAKRAAVIHLLFNVVGSVIFTIVAIVFFSFINVDFGNSLISRTEISVVHTVFNIACTALLYPFTNFLIYLSKKLVPEDTKEDETAFVHLDERIMSTPSFALSAAHKEILRMSEITQECFNDAVNLVRNKDPELMKKVYEREETIDALENAITQYLIKLANTELSSAENKILTQYLHVLTDLERVGDHCENIADSVAFMQEEKIDFTDIAKEELEELFSISISCFSHSIDVLRNARQEDLVSVQNEEEGTDVIVKKYRSAHIQRLATNECTPLNGVVFLDLLTNLERITDHSLNIAENSIIQ